MKAFLIALQFLTRIHVAKQTVWSDEDFGGSVKFFPLVGIVIGLLLCVIYAAFSSIWEGLYTAVLIVTAEFFITGGIHADGFMDTADGLFSGRDRSCMLEIMKDSRVGANGVMAFVLLVLLKVCFIAQITPPLMMAALICAPAASRFGTLISILEFPYARPQGLGKAFSTYATPYTLLWGFLFCLLPVLQFGFIPLIFIGGAMIAALLADSYIVGKLGGLTGDTYGAVTELTELLLLGLAALVGGLGI